MEEDIAAWMQKDFGVKLGDEPVLLHLNLELC